MVNARAGSDTRRQQRNLTPLPGVSPDTGTHLLNDNSFQPNRPIPARAKRSRAPLFGGVACGAGVFVLYLLLVGEPTPLNLAIGLVIGAALGIRVRLADL